MATGGTTSLSQNDEIRDDDALEEQHKKIIDTNIRKLKNFMVPDPLIDADENDFFEFREKRDIKEQKTTTEKNDMILTRVKQKDRNGYILFKKLLEKTHQEKLVEFLICTENGKETKEIEKDLYKLAKKRLNCYFERKKEFKENLIKFYKEKHSTVPLSPLVEEVDTNLAEFYVMPDMVQVKKTSRISHNHIRIPVGSLNKLLISEDQQKLYLSADAAIGKTSFSKYLAITWAQASCPDEKNKNYFKDEDLKALANFEFLFLVLLRDATAVCSIDKMIENQITKKLPPQESQYPLQEVLREEKCLIILDGLDEWTHPDFDCSDPREKIPHRYSRNDCVILTTTRPWKLGVSNLKESDIHKKVEFDELSQDSTKQLLKKAIGKMSDINDDNELQVKTGDLQRNIDLLGLKHMQTIPLFLMYITCLWCNKTPIGNNKVEVFTNIINFLLLRTAKKHQSFETAHSDVKKWSKKPKFCHESYSPLTALVELACHTLFKEKRQNTLVFDESVAKRFVKDLKLSFLTGILTGSTTTTLVEQTTKISFSHKTVQDFLAAKFLSSQSDGQKTVLEKCKNVQSILDMSTICEFLSNMNSNMMCELSAGFMSVINEDEETRKCRTKTNVYWYETPLYNIQKMLLSCFQEIPQNETIKLCLQDFFISNDTIQNTFLHCLSELNKVNMKTLYIDKENISCSLRELNELFSVTYLNNLQKLYYYGDMKEADLSLLLFPSLQSVEVSYALWTKYEGNLCENFDKLKNVQFLNIGSLTLCHEILEMIFNFVSGNSTMKELTLYNLSCNDHCGDCKKNFDLSINHSQLEKLELSWLPALDLSVTSRSLVDVTFADTGISESSLLLSRGMVNIKRVVLRNIKISANRVRDFIYFVENLPESVTVKLFKCDIKPEAEYEFVKKHIKVSDTFMMTHENELSFEFETTCTNIAGVRH